jgi:VIT1/CCC1 family predicted Fe2+/Mn2+ transporter
MVLSITGSLSVAEAGETDVRTMLIAAIGCNAAWGFVDAVMYLIDTLVERYRARALLDQLRHESDPRRGQEMIAARLPEVLAETIRPAELEHVRRELTARKELPDAGLTGRDLLGALGVFLLVFLSTFPVVLPFLFPLEPKVALRVSNGVAIALLFVVGLRVGKFVSYRPLLVGLGSVALGAALVAITIALGG